MDAGQIFLMQMPAMNGQAAGQGATTPAPLPSSTASGLFDDLIKCIAAAESRIISTAGEEAARNNSTAKAGDQPENRETVFQLVKLMTTAGNNFLTQDRSEPEQSEITALKREEGPEDNAGEKLSSENSFPPHSMMALLCPVQAEMAPKSATSAAEQRVPEVVAGSEVSAVQSLPAAVELSGMKPLMHSGMEEMLSAPAVSEKQELSKNQAESSSSRPAVNEPQFVSGAQSNLRTEAPQIDMPPVIEALSTVARQTMATPATLQSASPEAKVSTVNQAGVQFMFETESNLSQQTMATAATLQSASPEEKRGAAIQPEVQLVVESLPKSHFQMVATPATQQTVSAAMQDGAGSAQQLSASPGDRRQSAVAFFVDRGMAPVVSTPQEAPSNATATETSGMLCLAVGDGLPVEPARPVSRIKNSGFTHAVSSATALAAQLSSDKFAVKEAEAVPFQMAGSEMVFSGAEAADGSFSAGQEEPDFNGRHQQEIARPAPVELAVPNRLQTMLTETAESTQQIENPADQKHIVRQVKEQLTGHELKTGVEQVTLRLSPEHLGDLKLNFRMEDQRLKVEIVAENRMVRDALLQNSDSLKESLARQNIAMDSFDVTSGSSGGWQGQGRNDWRELAEQTRLRAWNHSGSYLKSVSEPSAAPLAYLAKSEHTMVDLHF